MSSTLPSTLAYAPLNTVDISPVLSMVIASMRDNPQHIAAFGEDETIRQQRLSRLFGLMATSPALQKHSVVALLDGRIVGVVGLAAPGECQPPASERLRMLPSLFRLGFGPARRAMTWLGAWAKHDLPEPHWHVGPVAVAPDLQGQGIGSALMAQALEIVDAADGVAYLETDKDINVTFYQRQGFEVVAEDRVLDVPNWFMRRPALSASAQIAA